MSYEAYEHHAGEADRWLEQAKTQPPDVGREALAVAQVHATLAAAAATMAAAER